MAKKKQPQKITSKVWQRVKSNLLPIALSIILLLLILIAYQMILADKYYPITKVGDTNISFLTKGQAIKLVQSKFQKRAGEKLQFSFSQGSFSVDLATTSAQIDYSALDENFKTSHSNPLVLFVIAKIEPKISFNLDKQLDAISSVADQPPQNAKLNFDETPASPTQRGEPNSESTPSARIQIIQGSNGFSLDQDELKKAVANYLLTGRYQPLLPLKTVPPKLTSAHVLRAKAALENLIDKPLKLVFGNQTWFIDAKQLLTLLDLQTGQDALLDKDKTYLFLGKIASETDREVQEGLFEFNPATKRVTAFKASQQGQKLDKDKAYQLLTDALSETGSSSKTITLPVNIIKPKIATSDVNNLGIRELLGRGISNFAGSIPNRIYNINLAASRINGVVIAPGEEFSFNEKVGDISGDSGYKPAYVIKEGRTVLDDGGGVCQVSTTVFRAVLNSGLPVTARTAHAYRVSYYEQGFPPGLDATVWAPSVDFKFKNDTQSHILIQAYTAGLTLYVDLYGTSDGRRVTLTKPVVTDQTPPPPDLRQDDPTLPRSTVKQVDWAAWGAQVWFKRTVTRAGQTIINETWRSSYKPWQAVYLVGTKE